MNEESEGHEMERLKPFIAEWAMEAVFPDAPRREMGGKDTGAHTFFEWLAGRQFVVQRWQVPHPDAPDGIAIIGFDHGMSAYLQHYFDSRGISRLYEMSFADGVWKLSRTEADFSPLSFSQRFEGKFSDDGRTIRGNWESSSDGETWELDFELIYTRLA